MTITQTGLDDYEPYVDDEGRIGFAVANLGGIIEIKLLNEWKAEDEKLGVALEQRAKLLIKVFRFSNRPLVDDEDEGLQSDIIRFLFEHIWFQDERYYHVIANQIICTWIRDRLTHATRPCFYGPTKTGKSRALKCLANLSYRGFHGITPTGAGLFRMIEKYHPTICIDELQALRDEKREDVDLIIKGGFEDGPGVARCNDSGGIDFFQVYGSMALGMKRQPVEDVQNRAILICMTQKPPNSELKDRVIRRKVDMEEAARLRGRLLAFRLRVLNGLIDLCPIIKEAEERAEAPIIIDEKDVLLDDRSIDKVSELLVPGIMFKDYDSTLELLAQSENDANQGLLETIEAKIFYALQQVYAPAPLMKGAKVNFAEIEKMSTRDVADQLQTDLNQTGDEQEPPKTQTVGKILRVLGFRFKRGHSNASMFDPESFKQAYDANLRKYGMRKGDEDEG